MWCDVCESYTIKLRTSMSAEFPKNTQVSFSPAETVNPQMEQVTPAPTESEKRDATQTQDQAQIERQVTDAADLAATHERLGMTPPKQENSQTSGMSQEDIQAITKRLGDIDSKTRNKEPLTKEDLEFLYEGKSVLSGQGKFRNEIIKERNDDLFEDMATILGITSRQIEVDPFEIKAYKQTAAYVGAITSDLIKKFSEFPNLRVYEKFPGKQLSLEEAKERANA
jgi:hypothetical protein